METIIIVALVVIGCIIAIIANNARKSEAPTIKPKIEPKQARDANGRFVKKAKK